MAFKTKLEVLLESIGGYANEYEEEDMWNEELELDPYRLVHNYAE